MTGAVIGLLLGIAIIVLRKPFSNLLNQEEIHIAVFGLIIILINLWDLLK